MIENDYLKHAITMQYDADPVIRHLADNVVDMHRKLAIATAKLEESETIISYLYNVRDCTVLPVEPDK